jgi:tetratricopeptide (TPR) repeat protein
MPSPSLRCVAPFAVLALLVPLPLGGCTTSRHAMADAESAVARSDWYQAWAAIQVARETSPDDPEIEQAYWKIRTGWLLWRAQQLVFHDQDDLALAELEKVLALDPENMIAGAWKEKAIEKLTTRSVESGESLQRSGQLEEALQAFHSALSHQPGNPRAEEGLAELGRTWQKQRDLARSHYLDGVRALSEQLIDQAQYHLAMALSLDPTLDEAVEPLRAVQRQIADERFARAHTLFEAHAFDAASRELSDLKKTYPALPGLDELLARAEAESQTTKLVDLSQMDIARGNLDGARKQLDSALALTQMQKFDVEDMMILLHERELDQAYYAAKDVELQGRIDEALANYVALGETNPTFRDVKERIADLKLRIEEATKAYEAGSAAEASGDVEGAISQFTSVLLYWPRYKDAVARIAKLRASRDVNRG